MIGGEFLERLAVFLCFWLVLKVYSSCSFCCVYFLALKVCFRVIFPSVFGRVEHFRPDIELDDDCSDETVAEIAEYWIAMTARKIMQVQRKYPSMKIVVAGWGTSCTMNHAVTIKWCLSMKKIMVF